MSDINIKFSGGGDDLGGIDSSAGTHMAALLDRLVAAITKLESTLGKMNRERTETPKPTPGPQDPYKTLGSSIGSAMGNIVAASVAATIFRYLNAETTALMGRASATGRFKAEAIGGNANAAFGGYVGSLWDIERQKRIDQNSALIQGGGAVAGAATAGLGTMLLAYLSKKPEILTKNAGKVMALGGLAGAAGGAYEAALKTNALTEEQMIESGALAKRRAEASVSEWQTGFSRFGTKLTSTQIVPGSFNNGRAVNVPLDQVFEKKYGGQNFNGIMNGIVPYLPGNGLDEKNGNLNIVSNQFKAAGFAANEFSKLTLQASQYQAISGKNIQSFAADLRAARTKFGYGYDINTNQTALNLMSAGFGHDQAQHLANQATYNPGILNGAALVSNASYSDYYRRKAISGMVGFNITQGLRTGGDSIPERVKALYRKRLESQASGEAPDITLEMLRSVGVDQAQLSSIVRKGKVSEQNLTKAERAALAKDPGLGPAGDEANQRSTMENLLANVKTMNVTATVVNLINGGGGGNKPGSINTVIGQIPASAMYSPAKP